MPNNLYARISLVIGLMILVVAAIGLAWWGTSYNFESEQTSQPSQIAASVATPINITVSAATSTSTTALVATPINTTAPLSPTILATSSPTAKPMADSEVAVGQAYVRPYSQFSARVKVLKVAEPPLITQDVAVQALYNKLGKLSWALGNSTLDGKLVSLSGTYGLVTEGEKAPSGLWIGNLNIPVQNCTVDGKCTPTGQILDHIENRLMWVLDYNNVYQPAAGPRVTPTNCQFGKPCTIPPEQSHVVYLVDAKTLQVMDNTSY